MYQKVRPLFLLCETPLHAGSGSDLGVVDLPIQRERHTSYPKIESSSLKGALREDFEASDSTNFIAADGKEYPINKGLRSNGKGVDIREPLTLAFGPEGEDSASAHAGALGFTDARILLFPVKSMRGVFAYITCPAVLHRFERDMRLVSGWEDFSISGIPNSSSFSNTDGNFAYYFEGCQAEIPGADAAILEEYTFNLATADKDKVKVSKKNLEEVALGTFFSEILAMEDDFLDAKLKTDILIISDNDFRDFVEMSTEVITRTKIDNETGTVQKGGLFTEEYLPSDSLMYTLVMSAPVFQPEDKRNGCLLKSEDDVMSYFEQGLNNKVIQLGANATLGKGLLRTKLLNGQNQENHDK
ncbi:MAG: type III-B CRISPR module RAMP protein Cmr4 [Lewinellaceae bacterium]|nr:type III-B CRISPR module RAMP protein Cmr4 [Lewinellaceae bacterium]